MFSLSYSPSTTAQSIPLCAPQNGCTWGNWQYSQSTVCIPITVNGETCDMCFIYEYRKCVGTNLYQSRVSGFSWPLPPCGIAAFLKNLLITNPTEYYNIIWSLEDQAETPCSVNLFLLLRDGNSDYDCLDSGNCSTNAPLLIDTYHARCREYITVYRAPYILIVGPGCPGFTYFVDCPSSGCCVKSRLLCYDNGVVRVCNETVTSYGTAGSCSDNATFTTPSGCDIIDRSGCIEASCIQP